MSTQEQVLRLRRTNGFLRRPVQLPTAHVFHGEEEASLLIAAPVDGCGCQNAPVLLVDAPKPVASGDDGTGGERGRHWNFRERSGGDVAEEKVGTSNRLDKERSTAREAEAGQSTAFGQSTNTTGTVRRLSDDAWLFGPRECREWTVLRRLNQQITRWRPQ